MDGAVVENPGDRAQRLLDVALELVAVVRDEDRRGITRHIGGIPAVDKDALLVVLAALVDVGQTAEDLLDWITRDENGNPIGAAA